MASTPSSYDDSVKSVNNQNVVDVADDSNDEEVPNKKSKPNSRGSKSQKRARPPKNPNVSDWNPGQPFVRTRKNSSPHWNHFVQGEVRDTASCIYCESVVSCLTRNGAGTLSNHLHACLNVPGNLDKKQKMLSFETTTIINDDGSTEIINVPKAWSFNHEKTRKSLAKMIIVDELPFRFVEGEGFQEFCMDMNPQFKISSRWTCARDCYEMFIEERRKLQIYFAKTNYRVCLTTDLWTSAQNLSYMCLTVHWIDGDWNLNKRIINFCQISGHTGKLIGKTIEKCLSEWDLKNVLTVTVDNASSNDVAVDYLRQKFNNSESDVLDGKYLHMRCAAHILNLVVKDGLHDLARSIVKLRTLVKYVKSSPARTQKFLACVVEEKLDSKSLLCLDVETRWNSTYLMLESAIKFKKAFGNLLVKDSILQKEMKKVGDNLTSMEWKQVSYFLPFLKFFYDATLKMSASRYVTSNDYVEVIFGVGEVISECLNDEEEGIKIMATQMKAKYEKYWGNVDNLNLLLFVSLFLDPRWKMTYVEWMVKARYGPINGTMLTMKIKCFLQTLFEFYDCSKSHPKEGPSSSSISTTSISLPSKEKTKDVMFNFGALLGKKFEMEMGGGEVEKKTELEKYMEERRESREPSFNILQWWKDNQRRYPILAKMAKDVLAIPVSTVASESAFSTGGRIVDSFRTSLSPKMVEALVCGQDWLRRSRTPLVIEDILLEMKKIEEGKLFFLTHFISIIFFRYYCQSVTLYLVIH